MRMSLRLVLPFVLLVRVVTATYAARFRELGPPSLPSVRTARCERYRVRTILRTTSYHAAPGIWSVHQSSPADLARSDKTAYSA